MSKFYFKETKYFFKKASGGRIGNRQKLFMAVLVVSVYSWLGLESLEISNMKHNPQG